jgi:outer membrane protein OmpA-like peptidoglycan-associated protein/tetratricopeptide (TPR) repeat protein
MLKHHLRCLAVAGVVALAGCDSAQQLTKKADRLYSQKGEYENAITVYKAILDKPEADKGYLNGQIAESYRLSNRPALAEPFYKAAIEAGYKPDSVLFNYAMNLKDNGKYKEATEQFAAYVKKGASKTKVARAKKESDLLPRMDDLMTKRSHYTVSNVEALNTASAEFSPFYTPTQLYFTSNRDGGPTYGKTGTGFTDLYTWKFENGDVNKGAAERMPADFNAASVNEASLALSKDGNTLVFAKGNNGERKGAKDVDLYISEYKDGNWSLPTLLPFSSPDTWDGCPAFSLDGKTLFFSSFRPGGQGGADLYRVTKDANGAWGAVTNLGSSINTDGEDMFPSMSEDGKLYFASTGHTGFGGLDLFVATVSGGKATVENLGVPMNSTGDDFALVFKDKADGYFSSNRAGGKGDDDIYSFHNGVNDPKKINIYLNGVAVDNENPSLPVPSPSVRITDDASGEVVTTVNGNADGKFQADLQPEKNYSLFTSADGFITKRGKFSTEGKAPKKEDLYEPETTINLDYSIAMERIKLKKAIRLDNIYYEFNKAEITDSAGIELDKLVSFLNDNSKVSIELSSHTDQRGKPEYNLKLSQKRAESAVAYIVSKGIDAKRITAKGYGASKPVVANASTEEEWQQNRRTEFAITKVAK